MAWTRAQPPKRKAMSAISQPSRNSILVQGHNNPVENQHRRILRTRSDFGHLRGVTSRAFHAVDPAYACSKFTTSVRTETRDQSSCAQLAHEVRHDRTNGSKSPNWIARRTVSRERRLPVYRAEWRGQTSTFPPVGTAPPASAAAWRCWLDCTAPGLKGWFRGRTLQMTTVWL